jgi:hypothetical protein
MAKTSLIAKQSSGNLNFSTAQKMIHRLLTHDRIKTDLDDEKIRGLGLCNDEPEVKIRAFTKEELAKKLGISPEEFERLKSPSFYEGIASKISLPLIILYCAAKFVCGEYKGKTV